MDLSSHNLFSELQLKSIYNKVSRPIIITDHIRTPENMGSILRLAGNIGALRTLFISDVAQTFKNYKINKTASGAAEKTDWQIINTEQLIQYLPKEYHLIALETTSDATSLFDFSFPEKVALLLGNEVSGISDELLKKAHHKVFIPIPGPITSLNVSHALSVALFEWLRQMAGN